MPLKSLSDWLSYIESIQPNSDGYDLENIRPIYKDIINSPLAKKVVIVGGTNGKGSTVEFLHDLYKNSGYKVGAYTSPHLFDFNERIKIDGRTASDKEIISAFEVIESCRKNVQLTYFDFATLAAFLIFSSSNLDLAILEIGIGGRLDPVNLTNPDISILTNIDIDHENWLGKTREEIGKEKAAIFRKDKIAIIASSNMPSSVHEQVKKIGSKVIEVQKDYKYKTEVDSMWSYMRLNSKNNLTISGLKHSNLSCDSASSALTAYFELGNSNSSLLKESVNKTNLKGRCDLYGERFLLDVSHNPASVRNLLSYIDSRFGPEKKITAIFGIMKDKDASEIIRTLKHRVNCWYATAPKTKRALRPNEVVKILIDICHQEVPIEESLSVSQSIKEAIINRPLDDIILIFGSFYTVSEGFNTLKQMKLVN
jgi:dihydrofolate synthase / folylpolyglutamate synthase